MTKKEALQKIPQDGFIKVTREQIQPLSKDQRTALIRKGNELFNNGNYEQAKRVFITTGYADGLSRMGDYYYKKNNFLEAMRMYYLAPAPGKRDRLIEKMAGVVQLWLHEKVSDDE